MGRTATYRSAGFLSSLLDGGGGRWGVDSWGDLESEQIGVRGAGQPHKTYSSSIQALVNCWEVIVPKKRPGHVPIFYFPLPRTQPGHSQALNANRHGCGLWLAMEAVSETSKSPWLCLLETKIHALSHPDLYWFNTHSVDLRCDQGFARLSRWFWGAIKVARNYCPMEKRVIRLPNTYCVPGTVWSMFLH